MSTTNRDIRTVHGKFNFGFKTKHRFPTIKPDSKKMSDLVNLLYPTGRAWNLPESSNYRKLHNSFNLSFLKVKDFMKSMVDSYIPDNDSFNSDNCSFWEQKLGLISNDETPLEIRKNIILRKISFPKGIEARQGLAYIQNQIDLYGFECEIRENIFQKPDGSFYHEDPVSFLNLTAVETQHGNPTQHGVNIQHGKSSYDVIANSMDDEVFNLGGNQNLWATFFITSKESINQPAIIPLNRKREFRELILKLKPAQLIAFCLTKYQ